MRLFWIVRSGALFALVISQLLLIHSVVIKSSFLWFTFLGLVNFHAVLILFLIKPSAVFVDKGKIEAEKYKEYLNKTKDLTKTFEADLHIFMSRIIGLEILCRIKDFPRYLLEKINENSPSQAIQIVTERYLEIRPWLDEYDQEISEQLEDNLGKIEKISRFAAKIRDVSAEVDDRIHQEYVEKFCEALRTFVRKAGGDDQLILRAVTEHLDQRQGWERSWSIFEDLSDSHDGDND